MQCLKDKGVMIIASGNITHNLGVVNFYNINAKSLEWSQKVDAYVGNAFTCNDIESLVNIETKCADFKTAHPSIDHYLPMFYIVRTRREEESLKTLTPIFQNTNLSMKGFMVF